MDAKVGSRVTEFNGSHLPDLAASRMYLKTVNSWCLKHPENPSSFVRFPLGLLPLYFLQDHSVSSSHDSLSESGLV